MKISLKTILRFAGVDLNDPLSLLQELLPLIGLTNLQNKLEHFFGTQITDSRRTQLVSELRGMADNLEKGQNVQAAKGLVGMLGQIKL